MDAGILLAGRAGNAGYFSGNLETGEPGSDGFANSLSGFAMLQGRAADQLSPTWSLRFAPEGAGDVVIDSPGQFVTTYEISPPAVAGTYQFRLTVTDIVTGDKDFMSTTLLLVAPTDQFSVNAGITQRIFVDDPEKAVETRIAAIVTGAAGTQDAVKTNWKLTTGPDGFDASGVKLDPPSSAVASVRFAGPVVFGGYLLEVTAINQEGDEASAVVNVRLEPRAF